VFSKLRKLAQQLHSKDKSTRTILQLQTMQETLIDGFAKTPATPQGSKKKKKKKKNLGLPTLVAPTSAHHQKDLA
jgi:hypothetical protein